MRIIQKTMKIIGSNKKITAPFVVPNLTSELNPGYLSKKIANIIYSKIIAGTARYRTREFLSASGEILLKSWEDENKLVIICCALNADSFFLRVEEYDRGGRVVVISGFANVAQAMEFESYGSYDEDEEENEAVLNMDLRGQLSWRYDD